MLTCCDRNGSDSLVWSTFVFLFARPSYMNIQKYSQHVEHILGQTEPSIKGHLRHNLSAKVKACNQSHKRNPSRDQHRHIMILRRIHHFSVRTSILLRGKFHGPGRWCAFKLHGAAGSTTDFNLIIAWTSSDTQISEIMNNWSSLTRQSGFTMEAE
jgi:hypothetical protein